MYWLLFAAFAQAQEPTYQPVRTAADCVLEARQKDSATGAALRATCTWADVDPHTLGEMVRTYDQYTEWLWPLKACRVVREEEGRTLVYQLQKIAPLAEREVLLWMTQTHDGPTTYVAWSAANEEPLTSRSGAVRTPVNSGVWSIQPDPAGGSRVIHQIEVDAGGLPVPGFLMDWIRQRGLISILKDVRKQASQKK